MIGDEGTVDKAESLRTCIATGQSQPKAGMLRFVIGPDNRPVPDLEEKLPGRGLWLGAERALLQTACAKNLFAKRARRQVDVDAGMPGQVETLLARRCIKWIELARRARQAIGGFDEVRRHLAADGAGYLLVASDGSADMQGKIVRLAGDMPKLDALTAAELGVAFGREKVAHGLVFHGGLGESLSRDMFRLSGVRAKELAT